MKPFVLFFTIAFSLFFFNSAIAQNYNTVYTVRVAAFEKTFDAIKLTERIGDLGVLQFANSEKNMRVYLGKYLGERTAKRVLRQVKKRGFRDAYIIADTYDLQSEKGKFNSHTFQIGAFKKLNATNLNYLHKDTKGDVYITYEQGVYRISIGLYNPKLPETKERIMNVARTVGPITQNGFDKQVRKVDETTLINFY